jgi:uncharacterized RDD family membrane protein YckC
MSVVSCPNCKHPVNPEAAGCPNCGANPRTGIVPEAVVTLEKQHRSRPGQGARLHLDYAPWWQRLLATAIDVLLSYAVLLVAAMAAGLVIGLTATSEYQADQSLDDFTAALPYLWWIGALLYFTLTEGVGGATLGKRLFRVRVVTEDGEEIGLGRAFVRNLLKMFTVPIVTLLFIVLSERSQRIGDKLAGTVVLKRTSPCTVPARAESDTDSVMAGQPPVVIAWFGPETGWAGRTISFVQQQFVLADHGPVTAHDVLEYDRLGQLEWAYEGLREWVGQIAGGGAGSQGGAQPSATERGGAAFCPGCGAALDPLRDSLCPGCGRAQTQTW